MLDVENITQNKQPSSQLHKPAQAYNKIKHYVVQTFYFRKEDIFTSTHYFPFRSSMSKALCHLRTYKCHIFIWVQIWL